MNVTTVLNVIGWSCLMISWVAPVFMKHKSESMNANKHLVGMLLGALALGFFASALVVSAMK